jgi:hypothetical protein
VSSRTPSISPRADRFALKSISARPFSASSGHRRLPNALLRRVTPFIDGSPGGPVVEVSRGNRCLFVAEGTGPDAPVTGHRAGLPTREPSAIRPAVGAPPSKPCSLAFCSDTMDLWTETAAGGVAQTRQKRWDSSGYPHALEDEIIPL